MRAEVRSSMGGGGLRLKGFMGVHILKQKKTHEASGPV